MIYDSTNKKYLPRETMDRLSYEGKKDKDIPFKNKTFNFENIADCLHAFFIFSEVKKNDVILDVYIYKHYYADIRVTKITPHENLTVKVDFRVVNIFNDHKGYPPIDVKTATLHPDASRIKFGDIEILPFPLSR